MKNRRIAIITELSLILMAIIARFSVGYAFSEFYQSDQIDSLKDNILNNQGLYRNMLIRKWLSLEKGGIKYTLPYKYIVL